MYLTDLEVKLAQDESGTHRDDILGRLQQHADEIKRAADGGLSPDDFAQAEKLQAALQAAQAVVKEVWKNENKESEAPPRFLV